MSQHTMHVRSVNVGGQREVEWAGQRVKTGIFKTPVGHPVQAAGVNLEGDDQADRSVHGGPDKAIYAFPSEHYPEWQDVYPEADFTWGAFGENLTTSHLLEEDAVIGAVYRAGDLVLRITEPRMPCFKLSIRLENKSVIKQMLQTGHTGFYCAIDHPGTVEAGTTLIRESVPRDGISVTLLTQLYRDKQPDPAKLRAALAAPGVPTGWRTWLQERLDG